MDQIRPTLTLVISIRNTQAFSLNLLIFYTETPHGLIFLPRFLYGSGIWVLFSGIAVPFWYYQRCQTFDYRGLPALGLAVKPLQGRTSVRLLLLVFFDLPEPSSICFSLVHFCPILLWPNNTPTPDHDWLMVVTMPWLGSWLVSCLQVMQGIG